MMDREHSTKLELQLIDIVSTFLSNNINIFERITFIKNRNDVSYDMQSLNAFREIGNVLFEGNINWGRVIAILALGNYFYTHYDITFFTLLKCEKYINDKVGHFININGGYEMCSEKFCIKNTRFKRFTDILRLYFLR